MNPRSFYISIGLHLGVVLLAIVGLPSLNRPLPEDQPLVTLEMVQTVPTTNVNEGGEVNTAKETKACRGPATRAAKIKTTAVSG